MVPPAVLSANQALGVYANGLALAVAHQLAAVDSLAVSFAADRNEAAALHARYKHCKPATDVAGFWRSGRRAFILLLFSWIIQCIFQHGVSAFSSQSP